VLRVHDENMPPPALPGKTLHQRTKSTPAFSTLLQANAVKAANKKVLGEVNANTKVARAARDDSDIGKASPGKMAAQELAKPAAAAIAFARPVTRPLAHKTTSDQTMPTTTIATITSVTAARDDVADPEPVRRIVAKKSTKVLKEVQDVCRPDAEARKAVSTTVMHPLLASSQPTVQPAAQTQVYTNAVASGTAVQHQEVRKTETIPLREEPAARLQAKPAPASISHVIPAGFVSEQEYMNFLAQTGQVHLQQPLGGNPAALPYVPADPPLVEHFYDVEDEEYYCEDGYTTARSFGLRGESTGGVTTVLAPQSSEKVKQELAAASAFVEATRTQEDIDDELWDMSMVAEYGDEIFSYMRDLEKRMAPNPRYMDQQQEIQWSMRAVLMDWVIQVHQRFNLLPETLFLTVNYIDRFLSCKIVSLGKLQLVGATAIFVAAKYEEVQCPTISEIIYMVDGGYSADELLKAERFMLSMLQFELGWPGPMSFLRRISKADDYDLETRTLAKYFLEVTIMDERFVGCTPSFLAAGAHCMARLMLRKGDWSPAHVFYSGYTYSQLRQLLTTVLECCEDPQKHHTAVFEKYVDKRYKRASTFVATEMQKGFQLPGVSRPTPAAPYDASFARLW